MKKILKSLTLNVYELKSDCPLKVSEFLVYLEDNFEFPIIKFKTNTVAMSASFSLRDLLGHFRF